MEVWKALRVSHIPTPPATTTNERPTQRHIWYKRPLGSLSIRFLSAYSPSQLTWLFQSTNAPCGLSRQAQTWSSKNEGMLKRLGAPTKLKTCPSSTGGVLLLAASQLAESRMNSTPTRVILPLKGS